MLSGAAENHRDINRYMEGRLIKTLANHHFFTLHIDNRHKFTGLIYFLIFLIKIFLSKILLTLVVKVNLPSGLSKLTKC